MKKISLMLMAFGLVATSCTKSEFDTIIDNSPKAKFSQEFANAYGTIAPNQDWGFSSNAMRGANSSFTKWQSDRNWSNMPENPVPNDEITYVLNYIAAHPDEGFDVCDFTDYYVQNIGSSKDKYHVNYLDANGNTHHSDDIVGGNQMDYLVIDGYHINDYNATSGSFGLANNMPLVDITYKDSYASLTIENAYKFYYIEYNGKVNVYLCFDYRTKKYDNGQMTFDGDGVYNDWVIKLSPADGRTVTKPDGSFKFGENARRIIAEDLAASDGSDFDYNDVVFDAEVRYENGKYIAYIQLLAAGGTIQLTVGGQDVHKAFGVPTTTMVNTHAQNGEDGATAELYTYEIVNPSTTDLVEMLKEIPIVAHVGSTSYALDAVKGHAAEKIAVGRDYEWTDERKAVETKHPGFKSYVEHPENTKWWN